MKEAAARLAARLGRAFERIVSFARPRACALGGALLGLAADWYGVLAGLLIGSMLDEAREEAATRSAIASFLKDPEGAFPPEPEPGLTAAAALAFLFAAGGLATSPLKERPGTLEETRALFERLATETQGRDRGRRREIERILDRVADDVARRTAGTDAWSFLCRALATRGSIRARSILADFAYEFRASHALGSGSRSRLDGGTELELRAFLADCGLGAAELAAARERAFPDYRDPWSVLGLSPGASTAELKRAYRRLSRKLHPDAAGGSEAAAAAFRELKDAYEEISATKIAGGTE